MDEQGPGCVAYLPGLTAGSAQWRLPLADHTAAELARILVVEPSDAAAGSVAELMSVDPALTLWTACVAGRWGGSPPRCVAELAGWFAHRGLAALRWPAAGPLGADPDTAPVKRGLRARWRDLSVSGVAVANLAAEAVADDAVAAESFLYGLLHNALDWLRTGGPRVTLAAADDSCLPGWLVELLRQRGKSSRCEAARHVARAAARWRDAGRREAGISGVDWTDVRRVRRWWQPGAPAGVRPLAPLLVALIPRLARLARLEQTFHEQLELEKLESLAELAYGASHEINNPLANISTRAQALVRGEADAERRRSLAIIATQALRAHEMIADMMLFARPPAPQREPVDLVAMLDGLVAELAEEAALQGTTLRRVSTVDQVCGQLDPTQLAAAIRALCVNSLEALGSQGWIELGVELADAGPDRPGRWARILVRDSGPGIPEPVRRHLFDPYFSGREAGRGLGLGLSKCWRIVSNHGGRVDVHSQLGQGTTFTVLLPLGPHDSQ